MARLLPLGLDAPDVSAYYQGARPEVRGLIPATAKRILDVGCAAGALGEALKNGRPDVEVVGIETNQSAAIAASKRLDSVFQGSVDELADFPYPRGYFDCLIFANVLEQLPDPEKTLNTLLPYLQEGGHVVISLPNVRHYVVLGSLLRDGHFTYQDEGILDRKTLHYYTYKEIEALCFRAGLNIEELGANRARLPGPTFQRMIDAVGLLGGDQEAYFNEGDVVQYLLRLKKPQGLENLRLGTFLAPGPQATAIAPQPEAPTLASIVMLTLNQLPYTKLCIESLFQYTPLPFELIVIDNGSTDGTRDYLQQLEETHFQVSIRLNDRNVGFAHGCNQGIAGARGEVVILLNNDTIVTENWLEGLLEPMLSDPTVGAVGPRSNQAGEGQGVTFVPYGAELPALHGFARWFAYIHRGQTHASYRLDGCCLAIRRSVFDLIGGLDSRFGIGNYEDDDLSMRIATSGHKLIVNDAVYIHHFGGRTFLGERVDVGATMAGNFRKFQEKWDFTAHEGIRGYSPARLASLPFEPTRDVFPILLDDAPGAVIEEPKACHFLMLPDWGSKETYLPALAAYCKAFNAKDDVALLLWVDPAGAYSLQWVMAELSSFLTQAELSNDEAPELVLFDAPGTPRTLSAVYRAAQIFLPSGNTSSTANALTCGLEVIKEPTPETLQAARRRRAESGGGFVV
jgi:GT2 family glycosyltransferase/2-polyprenyl-3-methyl-5-hydroxy-6-metoxy-1,4-benzoquinol methylase